MDNISTTVLNYPSRSNYRKKQRLIEYVSTRTKPSCDTRDVINLARNHPPFLYRMNFMKKLPVHNGCVNTICWNKTGEYILSGSDDCNLCITKPTYLFDDSKDYTVIHKVPTRHLGNIFSAAFLPNSNDSILVSSSSEGPVIVHDINSDNPSQGIFNFNCHSSLIFKVVTLQDDDKVFLTCGHDKTVRIFDLRCHRSCARSSTCPHPALIRNSHQLTTLAVHPINSNLLLVGRSDGIGLIYDRRKLPDPCNFSREKAHIDYLNGSNTMASTFKYLHPLEGAVSKLVVPDMEERCKFTSLSFSADGSQVLASYSQDYVYLFNLDKSSNFELIQTLPKRTPKTDDSNNSSESSSSTRIRQVGSFRRPRLRMRNDWSDTGINSIPRSSRSGPNSSPQFRNFLRALRFRRAGDRIQLINTVVRPEEREEPSESANSREVLNRDGIRIVVEERNSDVTNEDSPEEEADEFEININQSDVDNDRDEEDERDNVILDSSEGGESKQSKEEEQKEGICKISPETKLKFKKKFAELKSRYSRIPEYNPRVRYQGHRNTRTYIQSATFWGNDYIMSGSDCGRIMIWEKETAKLVMGFQGDERVVNCLAPNPHYYALASSGIDYDIKLWSTQGSSDCPLRITEEEMKSIVENNELMLEEEKQTITVPPHMFFQVLASFAHSRLN